MTRTALKALIAGAGLAALAGAAHAQGRYGGYHVPNGHLPPPGQCRVWYPDRPPGHQPPPTSCQAAERQADRYGGRVIYGGGEGRDDWDDDDDGYQHNRRFYRWALRNFDYNQDGRLSRREYRRALEAWHRR